MRLTWVYEKDGLGASLGHGDGGLGLFSGCTGLGSKYSRVECAVEATKSAQTAGKALNPVFGTFHIGFMALVAGIWAQLT
jgi:hypothetical protein